MAVRRVHRMTALNRTSGFTLIELMIALLIGIFLLGALLTIVQTNRTVFGDQNKMAQLIDAERMAMTMMSDVIQSAGYFPSPIANSQAGSLPSVTTPVPFASAQSIYGVHSTTAPGDTLSIRYMTANKDGILNCSGLDNETGGNLLYVNTFSVTPGGVLQCVVYNANGTNTYNLVGDGTSIIINNLTFLYGVNTSGSGNSVHTYMTADQLTSAQWSNVISVTVQLTFNNPMYTPSNTGQPQYITVQRVVSVMSQSGPAL